MGLRSRTMFGDIGTANYHSKDIQQQKILVSNADIRDYFKVQLLNLVLYFR